jgi:hypothetical protein
LRPRLSAAPRLCSIQRSTVNRIKAAAAAIAYERPKPATSLVVVDFRERVRQARLKAPLKTIEHMPDDEHIPEPA